MPPGVLMRYRSTGETFIGRCTLQAGAAGENGRLQCIGTTDPSFTAETSFPSQASPIPTHSHSRCVRLTSRLREEFLDR